MWAFLGVRGTIALALGLTLFASLGLLKWEHNAKIKAQSERDTAKMAAAISQQQILLYQEREEIKAKAGKKRGQINDWQQKGDLDSLRDDFNAPGGVRKLPANTPGGAQGSTGYYDSADPGTRYQEAPK